MLDKGLFAVFPIYIAPGNLSRFSLEAKKTEPYVIDDEHCALHQSYGGEV